MPYMASNVAFFLSDFKQISKKTPQRIIPSKFGQNPNNKEIVIGLTDGPIKRMVTDHNSSP